MKRYNLLLWVSGWIGLIANLLAILGTLDDRGWLPRVLDPGGVHFVIVFVSMAYSLCVFSVWVWKRTREHQPTGSSSTAAFLLNALGALPLLTMWVVMLVLEIFDLEGDSVRGWLLSLAFSWILTPFVAMALNFVGGAFGPLIVREES